MAAGEEQRIFLTGDEAVYNRGSVINELRDPFIQVPSEWKDRCWPLHIVAKNSKMFYDRSIMHYP